MANVLTVPNSGIISFDNRAYSDLTVPPLSTSARIGYDGGGGINITSYTTATTALDRFSVDGTQGRLFSVTDVLTGTLFSVNNITGLPILEVTDQNTVIAGQYNTNAFVLSGTRTGLGTTPLGTNRLSVSGDSTFVGTISTSNHGNSNQWNSAFTTVQANSASWEESSFVQNNFLPLSGGTITGNLTVNSNLSVLGTTTYIDTNVVLTSAMYIDTNSSETALRITQRGSGDVLRVEDSANPDSTPFVINNVGNVGIGLTVPTTTLEVSGTAKIRKTETSFQDSVLKVISTESSAGTQWRGRALFGAEDLTFLMGTFNGIAGLGAHSWTSANDESGAAWADLSINPDGNANVYIGGSGWDNSTAIVTVQNSTSNVGIGTSTPIVKLNIEGDFSAAPALKLGSLEFQPYALNNAWFGENVYLDGSNFLRRQAGAAGLFYFAGSEGQFRFAASDDAGTIVPYNIQLKINKDGKFGIGSNINYPSEDYTGSNLYVDGDNNVGIGTTTPNEKLTVVGNVSATGIVYASGGNSTNWDATNSFDLSYVGTLPVPNIPILTTTPLRDALLGTSGTQAATLRSGKWITGISIAGFNNPTIDNLISLSSSNIVGIRDSFSLSNLTRLTTLGFPVLASVGGAFTFNGGIMNFLTTVSLPSLASVGGAFTFNGAASSMNSLTTVSLPSLASVGGAFAFNGAAMNSLTTVSLPSLASVGGAFTFNSGFVGIMNSLTTVSLPSLVSVGGAFTFISGAASSMNSLTTVSLPSLASVGGAFTFNNSGSMNSLTTVSLPSLASVGGAFTFNGGIMNFLTTVSLPSLASVGGAFTFNNSGNMNSLTTLLIGSTLKHINGDFASGNVGLDRHNAWSANTYYPSATSFTAPASAFSSTTTGTTCSAAIANHGLQTNNIITVFGITGTTAATHNFNAAAVAVTRIDANNFSYTITATTQIPTGTATILRQEVTVTPVTKNGRKYICTGAGTSSGTEPVWPTTVGSTVTDGTVTWTCSEMSLPNILSRLDALSGTNQTTLYGANRFINIGPTTLITVNSITTTAGVATITTATNHGITTGTQIVISGCTGTALRYNGVWTATSTGLTTLTTPVPTDLNGVAGAGTMRLTNASPQFTGSMPISATTVTGISADSHMIFSATQLRDADSGTPLPIFVAGIYNRNGTTNGFARYSSTENSWDIWYDTTTKRWVNSPSQFTGNTAVVGDYPHTPQSVPLASTSSANPAVITSSVAHGIATAAVFTVVIEGCSNTALNGSWTATSTGSTTFTIPVNGSGGATTSSGTVTVLNQQFNQGRLMSGTVASPIQGVLQTITTTGNHGFTSGDFVHVYGAVGTHATSINDLNTNATTKSVTTAITVANATTFSFVRYANTQPFIGSYTLTTTPHMRDPSINDVAYFTSLKLRARGLAVSLVGTTGI
jgi:fibronectin-binding autotransporter adhesin